MLYYFHALFGLFDHSLIYAMLEPFDHSCHSYLLNAYCAPVIALGTEIHMVPAPFSILLLQLQKLAQPTQRHYLSKGKIFLQWRIQEKIWFWCDWIQELKWLHREQVSLHFFDLSCPLCWPHSRAISLPCNVQDNMSSILKPLLFSLPSATTVRIILPLYDNLQQCLTLKFFFFKVILHSFRIISPFFPILSGLYHPIYLVLTKHFLKVQMSEWMRKISQISIWILQVSN